MDPEIRPVFIGGLVSIPRDRPPHEAENCEHLDSIGLLRADFIDDHVWKDLDRWLRDTSPRKPLHQGDNRGCIARKYFISSLHHFHVLQPADSSIRGFSRQTRIRSLNDDVKLVVCRSLET